MSYVGRIPSCGSHLRAFLSQTLWQEAQQWTLDLLWKAPWWRKYTWSRDPAKHRAEQDAEYITVLALKSSSFSSVGPFALKEFPNTVMGDLTPLALPHVEIQVLLVCMDLA